MSNRLPQWAADEALRKVERFGNAQIGKKKQPAKKSVRRKQWHGLGRKDRQERQAQKKELKTFARTMRRHKTKAEAALWPYLNYSKMGVKFYQQYEFPPYFIVDFVCHVKRLIIEIDGSSHDGKKSYDQRRTTMLEGIGYSVIRFTNEEVMENIADVLSRLRDSLMSAPNANGKPFFEWPKGYVRTSRRSKAAKLNRELNLDMAQTVRRDANPSPEEIEKAKTVRGGWTREQLKEWGVPWPPPKGWKQSLIVSSKK